MILMNEISVYKALSNPVRRAILTWLKDPAKQFANWNPTDQEYGVCCGLIQKKANLSQSTISSYLSILESSHLLIGTRYKQWTYYKRNEAFIREFLLHLSDAL